MKKGVFEKGKKLVQVWVKDTRVSKNVLREQLM